MINKPEVISLRMSEEEKKLLVDVANQLNVSIAELAYRLVLHGLEDNTFCPDEHPEPIPKVPFTNGKQVHTNSFEELQSAANSDESEIDNAPIALRYLIEPDEQENESNQQMATPSESLEQQVASTANTETTGKQNHIFVKTEWGIVRRESSETTAPLHQQTEPVTNREMGASTTPQAQQQSEEPEPDIDFEEENNDSASVAVAISQSFEQGYRQGYTDTELIVRIRFERVLSDLLKRLLQYQPTALEREFRENLARWIKASSYLKTQFDEMGIDALWVAIHNSEPLTQQQA